MHSSSSMFFASALSTEREVERALPSLVGQIREQIKGRSIEAAFVFVSPHFARSAAAISSGLRRALKPQLLLGCTGEWIIGRDQEIEQQPAITLVAAHLPGVMLTPFALFKNWPRLAGQPGALRATIGAPTEPKLLIMLGDPFSSPMNSILDTFHAAYGDLPIVGGMASGSRQPNGNALLLNDQIYHSGAIGVALSGAFDVDVIVSQGCRPIGDTFTITQAHQNLIYALDGQPALLELQELFRDLPDEDRLLIQNSGLFMGRAIDPNQEILGRGDFLIRGVMGVDQESGVVAVGDHVEQGQIIQFHVRDADTAEEDLMMMLFPQSLYDPPRGALLFSCNGRGTRLYDQPNGDISTIQQALGGVSLAGFFCAGELGPIGGRNFVHGHTASLVLFRPQAG
ncbi:MAG: FIST signal transduction protein [Ardenticatenaceae bacterium]